MSRPNFTPQFIADKLMRNSSDPIGRARQSREGAAFRNDYERVAFYEEVEKILRERESC
jgi:hypothetical protein